MKDPLVRRKLAKYLNAKREKDGFHLWDRAIRKRLPKLADYAVARALASYSSADGTNCRPGLDRLADDLCASTKSVQRSIDYLTEHGWITLMNPGVRRRGEANDYSLSIPSWLAVELQVWTEHDGALWIERPKGTPRHAGGHRRPPKESLGGHSQKVGGHLRLVTVDTGVHPSLQCTTPDIHHSESLTRPRADAHGGDTKIDPDDLDAPELIAERVIEATGVCSPWVENLIDSMLAMGRPVPAIINAAIARERDGEADPFG